MSDGLRELLIIRHAKSDWSDDTLEDIDRPLADKGKKQACKMGHWLAEHDLIPELILVSPARRAQQTLSRLTRHWDRQPETQTVDALYNADLDTLIKTINQVQDSVQRVAVLGHNPGLEKLLAWLTGDEDNAHLSTCAIAEVLVPSDWQHLEQAKARQVIRATPKDAG